MLFFRLLVLPFPSFARSLVSRRRFLISTFLRFRPANQQEADGKEDVEEVDGREDEGEDGKEDEEEAVKEEEIGERNFPKRRH